MLQTRQQIGATGMRRIFFWTHFAMGLAAGVFILLMSVTGVLLTYERQIVAAAQNAAVHAEAGAEPLSVNALADAAVQAGGGPGNVLALPRDRGDVVQLSKGRRETLLLDPYTGDVIPDAGASVEAFFSRVERIHRWLAFSGGRSDVGAAINDASNLLFGLLLLSGTVLWWPKKWKWAFVKTQLFFRRGLPNAKARHYNWHHVLAAWSFVPLMAIVVSGAVFSYGWANRLVYAAYGEALPSGPAQQAEAPSAAPDVFTGTPASLDLLAEQATADFSNWQRLAITLPAAEATSVSMSVDWGNGVQAAKKRTVTLARDGSGLVGAPVGDTGSAGQKARRFLRFLHTGEVYGLIGQTLAGLASLASVVLVYTGISLAFRRLARMRRNAKS